MSDEQAALFTAIGEAYGTNAGLALLSLACDRLESPPCANAEHAMPLLLWEFAGAFTIPQVHPEWDFKPLTSAAVSDGA